MDFRPDELDDVRDADSQALRGVPVDVLAFARARPLPDGVRRRAHPARLAGGADPRASTAAAGSIFTGACAILEEIAASGANPAACHAQMYVMGTLLRHGSEAQKVRYLPAIAAGELRLQAFGVSEAEAGSDTPRIRTRAVRTADGYRIDGRKIWISRAAHSDLMILLARTTPLEDVTRRTDGLSVFLIDLRDSR